MAMHRVRPLEIKSARTKDIEHAAFPLTKVKSLDGAQGIFEGYLAVFDNLDANGDIIEKGAFKRTLMDAYEVKRRTETKFLFPLLWMHDDKLFPAGGFTDMSEDNHGLYVKGQCDLNTEMGRNVFSGMQMGYINGLSIGYNTIKATRDTKGIRHLTELRLWEGSAITVGYQANPDALITQTKSRRGSAMRATKAVSGKTSWPLAARDRAWDNGAAHDRIVAWATDDAGTLDESKMKSVHFWYDDSAPDKVTSYKLLFCDVINGDVQAVPAAIEACTGSHGIEGTKGISADDTAGIKSKIGTLYKRMAKQFDDDSIVVPWEEKRLALRKDLERKGMSGLQVLTTGLSMIDCYGDMIDAWLEHIGDTCGLDLDPDEGYEDASVGDQLAAAAIPGMAVHPTVKALLDNVSGLQEGLIKLGNAFQALDDATDAVLDALGMSPEDEGDSDSAMGYGYMAAHRQATEGKVSRALSADNRKTIQGVMDGMMEHHGTLKDMLQKNDPTRQQKFGLPPMDGKRTQPEPSATTDPSATGEPDPTDTTLQDMLTGMKLDLLLSDMKAN